MARKKKDIRLVVKAEVDKAIRNLDRAEDKIDNMSVAGSRATPVFSKLGGAVTGFIAVLSIRQVVDFTIEVSKLADSVAQVEEPFKRFVNLAGKDSKTALNELRKAVRGTASDLELMQIASRSMDAFTESGLGAEEAFEAVQKTMDFLFRYSVKFGKDFNGLMNTVFTGLQRGSAVFLDDVGIMIDQTDEQFKGLNSIEKKAKTVTIALEQMANKNKILGEVTEGSNVQINQAAAAFDNLKAEIGKLLEEPTSDVLKLLAATFRALNDYIKYKRLTSAIDELIPIDREIKRIKALKAEFEDLGKQIDSLKFKAQTTDEINEIGQLIEKRAEIETELNEIGEERLKKLEAEEKRLMAIISGEEKIEKIKKKPPPTPVVDPNAAIRAKAEAKRQAEEYEGAQKLIRESSEETAKELIENANRIVKHYEELAAKNVELDREQIEMVKELSETSIAEAIAVSEYLIENWEFTEEEKKKLLELRKGWIQEAADEEIRQAERAAFAIQDIMAAPMQRMVEDILQGTKKSKDIWSDFIDYLMSELRRFIASQLVATFFQFFLNLISGPAGAANMGALLLSPSAPTGTKKIATIPLNPISSDRISLPKLSTGLPAPSFMQPGTISNITTDNSQKIDMGNFQVVVNGPVYGEDATLLNSVKRLQQEHQHRLGKHLNKPIL